MSKTPALALNHLNLPADDPAKLREWYVSKLGFRSSGGGAILWSGGSCIAFVKGKLLATPPTSFHFGFRLSSLDELRTWVATLRERGVAVGEIQGDAEYSRVYVKDPEGNTVELFFEKLDE